MAKYYGHIGFSQLISERPGITYEDIVERPYFGEIIRNARRIGSSDKINEDIVLSNRISLLLDPYLTKNYYNIRYLTFMGAKWNVTNVEMQYPRLIVDIGGLYAEQPDGDSSDFM